jgi:hypothetical protein
MTQRGRLVSSYMVGSLVAVLDHVAKHLVDIGEVELELNSYYRDAPPEDF